MKKRRGRRGFWWWSWLLALTTIGGVVGGYMYGEKRWEDAPKEYFASATLSFQVREPFSSKKAGIEIPSSSLANANEAEVLRKTKSEEELSLVLSKLELTDKWAMGTREAVTLLQTAVELDLDQETGDLRVAVTLYDPEESAQVANTIAAGIPAIIKQLDEAKKAAAFKLLEVEAQPFLDLEIDARDSLKNALASKGINIKIEPGVVLGTYNEIPEVLAAKVEWDSAREDVADMKKEQIEYRGYWARAPRLSYVSQKAEVPPRFVGPEVKPFQMRWSTYGLTAGLMLGSLLMLGCWKLFP